MAIPRLSKLANDYAGDLVLPLATLTAGGSKLLASMQLVGGVIVTKVLGPLGAISGIVYGIVTALRNWEQTAQLVARSMEKAAAKEELTKQFGALTKSVALAKVAVQDLFTFAQKTPFRFEGVLEGGKALAEVSNGSLVTKKNLELVGDSAAASGQKFETVAGKVADAYSALKNGQPVQTSAEALKGLGLISESTVQQLVTLQASGAGIAATFGIVTQALEANKGAMTGVKQTVEDLTGKQEQIKAGILAPAGQILNQGKEQGLQAQNELLEKLAPTLTTAGQVGARASTAIGYLQNGIVSLIAKIPGLSQVFDGLVAVTTLFIGTVVTLSGVKLGAKLLEWAAAMTAYARATGLATAAQEALNASQGRISIGRGQLAAAIAPAQGPITEAGEVAETSLAARGALAASGARNVAAGAGKGIVGAGIGLLTSSVKYLAEGLAGLLTYTGLAAASIAALALGAVYLGNKFETANESISDMEKATNDANTAIRKQIADVQTASDAAAVYATSIDGVTAALANQQKVNAQRSTTPIIGGLINYFQQQDLAEQVADSATQTALINARAAKAKQASPDLADSKEYYDQTVQALISQGQAQRSAEDIFLTPEQQADAAKAREQRARDEAQAQEDTRKKLSGVTSDTAAQGIYAASGSQVMRFTGQLNAAKTPKEKQDIQRQIDVTKSLIGQPGDFIGDYIAKGNQNKFREETAGIEQKGLDIQKKTLELDKEATRAAEDQVGALQYQIDLINHRKDLTATEKANAIETLKITQFQAAAEVYRGNVARQVSTEQIQSQALIMRGQLAQGRETANQAAKEDADAREAATNAEEYAKNIAAGMPEEQAKAAASAAASQERQNAALGSFLAKQQELARLTIQTPVGPFAPNTANYYTAEEAAAGRGAGYGVSDNQVQQPPVPPGSEQFGGPSPLDAPVSASHHGIGDLGHGSLFPGASPGHFSMDSLFGTVGASAKPLSPLLKASDPLLTENKLQTGLLQKIAENTAKQLQEKLSKSL